MKVRFNPVTIQMVYLDCSCGNGHYQWRESKRDDNGREVTLHECTGCKRTVEIMDWSFPHPAIHTPLPEGDFHMGNAGGHNLVLEYDISELKFTKKKGRLVGTFPC